MSYRINLRHDGDNHLIVPVAVSPVPGGPFRVEIDKVVLDTGAGITQLTQHALRTLVPDSASFWRGQPATLSGVGGEASSVPVLIPELFVDFVAFQNVWVAVADLPYGLNGLLGGDILRQFRQFSLDYDEAQPFMGFDHMPDAGAAASGESVPNP